MSLLFAAILMKMNLLCYNLWQLQYITAIWQHVTAI